MPITPLSNVLNYPQKPEDNLPPVDIDLGDNDPNKTENPDGSVDIDLTGASAKSTRKSDKFTSNLAEGMREEELNRISTEILEGIERDNQSRSDHLTMIAEGMKLLGLVIESNNASSVSSSAPLEGMSTVRHPLLLEACQLFQANAMGELLPASGPVKVRDDRPQMPLGVSNPFTLPGAASPPPGSGAPGVAAGASAPPGAGAPIGAGMQPPPSAAPMAAAPPPVGPMPPAEPPGDERDELADALEKDFNHYLTTTAREYYPDTDQMLFKTGFGGLGIKKVYNCPLRRRPVSESIDIDDFIVSNALTDLSNAGRITHRIKMRPSVLKRMQILGVYRDVLIGQPTQVSDQENQV